MRDEILKNENSQAYPKQNKVINKKEDDGSTLVKIDIADDVCEEWKIEEDKMLASISII